MKNHKFLTVIVIILSMIDTSFAQTPKVGIFDTAVDVGKPKLTGSSSYDSTKQEYSLKGAGYNIWFNRDEFHYVASRIKGDFIVTADFEFPNPIGKDPHRKYGWMVRENLQEDAAHFTATIHGDGLTVAQWRVMRGAHMRDPQDELFFPKKKARTIQIERKGKTYTMRIANAGEPLQSYGSITMENIGDNPYVGLFVGSHNADAIEEARVWNVRVDKIMPLNFNFNGADSIGSRLEILDVFTGNRKVVYENPTRFEAPNWMPDGKKLLFNSKGSIWTIPIDGSAEPTKLNTGTVERNNNDHVISFDGKMLGISSSRTGMFGGGSTIYVLPITGGEPKLVTEKTPSYLHGWAANNKEVYYVARRDTNRNSLYHVFKANIDNGVETQLTRYTFGHVDGPEGSPDGKWIAYISFADDIDPITHPGGKSVSLKLMPVNGGFPRTIAHLYGGQGTINTPSWSPDSKKIAFVSYSGRVK